MRILSLVHQSRITSRLDRDGVVESSIYPLTGLCSGNFENYQLTVERCEMVREQSSKLLLVAIIRLRCQKVREILELIYCHIFIRKCCEITLSVCWATRTKWDACQMRIARMSHAASSSRSQNLPRKLVTSWEVAVSKAPCMTAAFAQWCSINSMVTQIKAKSCEVTIRKQQS